MEVSELKDRLVLFAENHFPNMLYCGITGSVARGTSQAHSDIDLFLLVDESMESGSTYVAYLETKKLDIVVQNVITLITELQMSRLRGTSVLPRFIEGSIMLWDASQYHTIITSMARSALEAGPTQPSKKMIAHYRDKIDNIIRNHRIERSPVERALIVCDLVEAYVRVVLRSWFDGCGAHGLMLLRKKDPRFYTMMMALAEGKSGDIREIASGILNQMGGPLGEDDVECLSTSHM